jgi:L-lysine 2,3-aminomutase
LTDLAIKAIGLLQKAGSLIANQMPLIRGVNDKPHILAELLSKLSFIGVAPYYIFQCRPALGNKTYTVPIEQGYGNCRAGKALVSGLAKRAGSSCRTQPARSKSSAGRKNFVYFKYHRAANDADSGRFLAWGSNRMLTA